MLLFGLNDESQATRRGEPKGRYDLELILARRWRWRASAS